jgi:hypothetical protein
LTALKSADRIGQQHSRAIPQGSAHFSGESIKLSDSCTGGTCFRPRASGASTAIAIEWHIEILPLANRARFYFSGADQKKFGAEQLSSFQAALDFFTILLHAAQRGDITNHVTSDGKILQCQSRTGDRSSQK